MRAPSLVSTAVVVSYRPGKWLRSCLESVVGQADQVLVVDNGSEDAAASVIARSWGAVPVRSEVNRGFAGGVDLGLRHATGELIGILNDDAVASANWLPAAAEVLLDASVGAVTPKVLLAGTFAEVQLDDDPWHAPGDGRDLGRQLRSVTADSVEVLDRLCGVGVHRVETNAGGTWRWTRGRAPFYVPLASGGGEVRLDGVPVPTVEVPSLLNHAGSFLHTYGMAGEYGFAAPDDGRFDVRADRFGFSGTAPVFRADTLRRIGAFPPQYFAYNEDTDWCVRAHLNGLRVVYDPAATIRHRLSATSGGLASPLVRMLAERNSLLCLVRTAPLSVARHYVGRRLADGPGAGVRRSLLRRLPWAVGTRAVMRRSWKVSPEEVWAEWAERHATWDTGPQRAAGSPSSGVDDPV